MWHTYAPLVSICCGFVVQFVVQRSASLAASRTTCCTTNPQLIEIMESDTNGTTTNRPKSKSNPDQVVPRTHVKDRVLQQTTTS